MADLIDRLKVAEGFRAKPYRDTRGILTIGYGTDIEKGLADGEIEWLNSHRGEQTDILKSGITKVEAEWLLRHRVAEKQREIAREWPYYAHLADQLKDALVDAAYQLGVDGLLKFHRMLAAIERSDWGAAEREARDSEWNGETPHRVDDLVEVLRAQVPPSR